MAKPKYKIRNGETMAFPGLPGVLYTNEHLNGPNGEMIVRAMKKLDTKAKASNFEKLVEEVK